LGILSLTVFHFIAGIPAVIVGRSARAKIRANPQQLTGEGMAAAGIVMGWISIGIACCVVLAILVFLIILAIAATH
jgi:magnesium-transporting ATPase (P-type)